MEEKLNAITLKAVDYGESDKILTLFSLEKGVISATVKGVKKDKAKHTVLPLSKFCLMQITRQRVRPAVDVDLSEVCPLCNGSGKIKSSMVVVDEIESDIKYLAQEQNEKSLTVIVHPFVRSYIIAGLFKSIRRKWQKKYKIKIKIISSSDYGIMQYSFLNADNEEVKL